MSVIRLNKALAEAGVCSRRKADELIQSGAVSINGTVTREMGVKVDPKVDTLRIHGQPISFSGQAPGNHERHYLLLNKPIQVVSTVSDPEGRRTVMDFVPRGLRGRDRLYPARLYPVGRLDYFSEGLLLLTDDGELTNRLTHPRYHLPKTYEVRLRELPDQTQLRTMREGMVLREGERLAPVEARISAPDTLMLTLHQGINRQIRRMCRDLDLVILRLRRVRLGPLSLGSLAPGQCRPLLDAEVASLRKAAGLHP